MCAECIHIPCYCVNLVLILCSSAELYVLKVGVFCHAHLQKSAIFECHFEVLLDKLEG